MSNTLGRPITLRSLLKFTLPSIIMMVVMALYSVVDGTFVSRLVNTDAFSAINIIFPLTSLVIALGTMFGAGITAIVSKKLGEGKQQEANENITFVVVFTLILGVILSIGIFIFIKPLIYILGANDTVFDYCYQYAFPLLFFIPASLLQLLFQSLFVANGKPHIGLLVTLLGGITNVVLDYVFIAIFNMGISGAAIATGIGYMIPAIYGLFYFTFHKKANLYFVKPKTDWTVLKQAIFNGSSEMVSNLSGSITTFLFNVIMMHYLGPDGVAAIAIILYLDFVLIAISLGYSMGVAPIISYNYGSHSHHKLKKIYRLSAILCFGVGIFTTAMTLSSSHFLAGIFSPRGTYVFELAVVGLGTYAFSYIFKGFNIFTSAMFTAFSDGKTSAILSFMRTLVLLVSATLILTYFFGVNGLWFAPIISEGLSFLLSFYYTYHYKNKYQYI